MLKKVAISLAVYALMLISGPSFAAVSYVGSCGTADYSSIKDAVLAAQPFDTIVVCPGTYTEGSVLVDFGGNTEGVTITSTNLHDPDQTTVVGGFKIVSDYVTIKGLKITVGNDDNHVCVEISGDYATVAFNHITGCNYGGIRTNQAVGVFASSGNSILHNVIENNAYFGINVEGTDTSIHHNTIVNNDPVGTTNYNFGGIMLQDISSGGEIHHNTTAGNQAYGINIRGDNYHIHNNNVCDGIILQNSASGIFLHNNEVAPSIINNGATHSKIKNNSDNDSCGGPV